MSIGGNNPDQSRYYNPSGPGINSVGSFQVSGRPYLTGTLLATNSSLQINFPTVTKELHFSCHTPGKYFKVYFDNPGTNPVSMQAHNFAVCSGTISGALDLNIKCDNLFIINDCGSTIELELHAALTGIPTTSMFALSGSGINA